MLRILAFFLIVLAAALGFAWLADNPGSIALTWQGREVETSFLVFVVAEIVAVAAILFVVWIVRAFFKTPDAIGSYFRGRRRDRGYQALSTGIIAAGAGDSVEARRMTKRSQSLLKARKEPLVRFLDAQTAMIEGDHSRARSAFEAMERDPETRLLALRGLYLEAERLGDDAPARHYAERAVRIAPHLPWAGGAVLESKSLEGDWDGALQILEAQKNSRLVDKDESKRMRAVLLTAKAMTISESDPAGAKAAALEAQKLAPDLVPAAVTAARAMFRLGDLKRGSRALEKAWTEQPHPEIAETYVHARPGDSVGDRLKRAKALQAIRQNHVESSLAVAHAALDAQDYALAREEALAAVRMAPRESAYLLLADIEEAETGEEGRVREWLARAIRAPRDPAWTADGFVSDHWAPVSPVTGQIDAFRWKVPVERIGSDGIVIDAEAETEMRTISALRVPETEARPGTTAAEESAESAADIDAAAGASTPFEPGLSSSRPSSVDAEGGTGETPRAYTNGAGPSEAEVERSEPGERAPQPVEIRSRAV